MNFPMPAKKFFAINHKYAIILHLDIYPDCCQSNILAAAVVLS